jgi:hypothetical protein
MDIIVAEEELITIKINKISILSYKKLKGDNKKWLIYPHA